MIKNLDACRVIEENRGDAIVVTTMGAGNPRFGWPVVSHNEELDIPVGGAMGKASSFALGLALAKPERKVIILDGDGSLVSPSRIARPTSCTNNSWRTPPWSWFQFHGRGRPWQ